MDLSRYLSLFVGEAAEHVAGLSQGLVALEQSVRSGSDAGPVIDGIFRHVHSIKGMSASMQLDGIATLAHQAEDLVDLYRRHLAKAEPAAVDALLATCDALQEMIAAAAQGQKPAPDAALLTRLGELTRRARDGRPAQAEAAPEPARPPAAMPRRRLRSRRRRPRSRSRRSSRGHAGSRWRSRWPPPARCRRCAPSWW